jgi:hypothetical protein
MPPNLYQGNQNNSSMPKPSRGGGMNNKPNRNNRGGKKKKRPSGLGPAPGGTADVTDGENSTFAVADPQSYLRGMLQQAGFDPYQNNAYGTFLNDMVAQWEAGWNQFQTQAGNATKNLYDYLASKGLGTMTPGGPGAVQSYQEWVAQKGRKKVKKKKKLKGAYQTYVDTQAPDPSFTPAANLANQVTTAFNAYSPQELGLYDAGKRPGSVRWNIFG